MENADNTEPRAEAAFDNAPTSGFWADYWDFLKTSKKWWMLPLLVLLLALGALIVLGKTAAAPLIYSLF